MEEDRGTIARGGAGSRRRRGRRAGPGIALLAAIGLAALPRPADAKQGIEVAADALQYVIPGIGVGKIVYHHDWRGAGWLALSGAVSGGTTWVLKTSIDATRPNGGSHSFPSGHTAAVAWGTGFLHRRYGWRWALAGYAATGFVAWSRVETGDHHVEDVIAGAAIGLAAGYFINKPFEGRDLRVSPSVGGRAFGLTIAGRW